MRIELLLILAMGCRAGYQVDGDGDASPAADAVIPGCGNGVVETGESCDDGNDSELDGCRNDCTLARCGDGVVRTTVEGCDDQNTDVNDGCTADCLTAPDAAAIACSADDRCFGLYNDAIPWASLEASCNDKGGRRAVFNSAAENDLVATQLAIPEVAWIGLTFDSGNWDWGVPEGTAGFLLFAEGFPTVEAEGRSVLLRSDTRWRDEPQISSHPYICLFEPRWRLDPETGHAYGPVAGEDTFSGNRILCRNLGFDLVSVTSAEENLLVTAAAVGERRWLGLMIDPESTEQTWVDGEPLGYTNWAPGNPGDSADCIELERNGTWETESCAGTRLAFCEAK